MIELAIWLVSAFVVFYTVMLAIAAFGAAVVAICMPDYDARGERLAHEAARRVKRRAKRVTMSREQIERHTAALYLDLCAGRLA